jgi:polysaccharide deacetylase family protein (PEP-CTERM system associated)
MSALEPTNPPGATGGRAPFLFSVDLEDVRSLVPGGERFRDGVPPSVERYLDLLAAFDARCTFFTVGDVARRHPALLRELRSRGHELACHSSDHRTLDRHDPASFRADVLRNVDDLRAAGADRILGFRAPTLSLTGETAWAWEVLGELGFSYSSSVLPARNPLFGWPDFGRHPVHVEGGLWEIPVSLSGLRLLDVPFAAGVYFRVLPFALVRSLFRRHVDGGRAVVGYFHPYDVDAEQERFLHPGLGGSRFYNWLMYRNRRAVIPRLRRLLAEGAPVLTYAAYVEEHLEPPPAA